MKKSKKIMSVFAVVSLTAVLIFPGCAKKAQTTETPPGVEVDGSQITVTYEENPTTGYEWTYAIDHEKVVQYASDTYSADENDKDLSGVGGEHTFVFEAGEPGEAEITLQLARSWEDKEPKQSVTLHVKVDDSKTVTVQ